MAPPERRSASRSYSGLEDEVEAEEQLEERLVAAVGGCLWPGGKHLRHPGATNVSAISHAEAWRCQAQPHDVRPLMCGCLRWSLPRGRVETT